MRGSLDALKNELSGLRTGRASAHLLDACRSASTAPDAAQPGGDGPGAGAAHHLGEGLGQGQGLRAVEKAIREANLGLNPVIEGALLRLPIPMLKAERRTELAKLAHKYAEQAASPCATYAARGWTPQEAREGRQDEPGRPSQVRPRCRS